MNTSNTSEQSGEEIDYRTLKADANGLAVLRENHRFFFYLMSDWYEATVNATRYAAEGEPIEVPKGYYEWGRLIALWADAQRLTISPEPLLRLSDAIWARQVKLVCGCGIRLQRIRAEHLGICFKCKTPINRGKWMRASKMELLLDRVQRTKERMETLARAMGPMMPRARLEIKKGPNPVAVYDGTEYSITPNAADFLQLLLDGGGEFVKATKAADDESENDFRPARLKKTLPKPLADLVESKPAKGCRLLPDAWFK